MTITRFSSNSSRPREGGFGATHKQDFVAHVTGGDWRHKADQIDLANSIPNLSATNVQDALVQLEALSVGTSFITIGDGYHSVGTYTVGVDGYSFETTINKAFLDSRLSNGGLILIKAGSYSMSTSVTVPAGISLMGEIAGTIINGAMNEQSMFIIQNITSSVNIGGDTGSGPISANPGSNSQKVKFSNFILADNLTSGTGSGMTTVPMITVRKGADFECDNVTFFGRVNNGTVTNRLKTWSVIGTSGTGSLGTNVILTNCYIDGVRQAVNMTTGIADKDTLIIKNCKIRWFGKEAVSYDPVADSGIYLSLCNATIVDSYIVSVGALAQTFLTLATTSGDTSNVRIVLSGLTGYTSGANGVLVSNLSSVTSIQMSNTGNNWSGNIGNPWFLTVGGANNAKGDLYGANAINTIINYARLGFFTGTVIVNPGFYSVTVSTISSQNFANITFKGNKQGNIYPVFQLNIQTSPTVVDQLGNFYLTLGNNIESIYFTSVGANFNSIRPSFSATSDTAQIASQTLTVKDCVFKDVCLNILGLGAGAITDETGAVSQAIINVENCYFNQTGTYANNLSFNSPVANIVNLTNCYFIGNGYGIVIGPNNSSDVSIQRPTINLDRVFCDFTGNSVTAISPSSGQGSHIDIEYNNATINITNSEFLVSNVLANVTTFVGGTLASGGLYTCFSFLKANNINVRNTTINGPNQTFTFSAVDYPMPGMILQPLIGARIENCSFIGGALPLQIQTILSSNTLKESIIITNNNFASANAGVATQKSQTLLDIDIDSSSSATTTIIVSNNNFKNTPQTSPIQPKHVNLTGANYDTNACVQIYCKGVNARVFGNHITTPLRIPSPNPFNHCAGLYVNTYSGTSTNTTLVTSCFVNQNYISIQVNNFHTATSTNSATCVKVLSTIANITNNTLIFANVTVDASIAACLYVDTRVVTSVGNGMVSHNQFSRGNDSGVLASLSGGYIAIPSSCNTGGQIINNSFDSTTIDGSITTFVQDNSTASTHWIFTQNKNQTETLTVRGNVGLFGIADPTTTLKYVVVGKSIATNSFIDFNYLNSSLNAIEFDYADTTVDQQFLWSIPISEIIPEGAYIVSASITPLLSSNPSITSIATLNGLKSGSTTTFNQTVNPLTTSGATLSFSGGTIGDLQSRPDLSTTIEFSWRVKGAAPSVLAAGPMTIVFRW